MNTKGFTLIELIVVIAIIAILAAVAVPSYINVQNSARDQVARANAGIIASAINTHNTLFDAGIATIAADVPVLTTLDAFTAACDVTITMSAAEFTAALPYVVYAAAGNVATILAPGVTPAAS